MRAVRKVGYFAPIFPDDQGDRSSYCVPIHRTTQILSHSKTSDNELKRTIFPTKNDCCFCLVDVAPVVVGGFRMVTGMSSY